MRKRVGFLVLPLLLIVCLLGCGGEIASTEGINTSAEEPLTIDPIKASVESSIEASRIESIAESISESIAESLAESIEESVKESIDQSIEESIQESIDESIAESIEAEIQEKRIQASIEASKALEEAERAYREQIARQNREQFDREVQQIKARYEPLLAEYDAVNENLANQALEKKASFDKYSSQLAAFNNETGWVNNYLQSRGIPATVEARAMARSVYQDEKAKAVNKYNYASSEYEFAMRRLNDSIAYRLQMEERMNQEIQSARDLWKIYD